MYNWFDEYLAEGWKDYWSRGWCRVEVMLASVKPVAEGRAELFRGQMKVHLLGGHRPHVLFGTKELERNAPPIFLPPLLHSYFETFAPERGELTKEADRVAVRRLTVEACKDVKELVVGWQGDYQGVDVGRGKYVWDDGGFEEGEYKDGKLHGHGKYLFSYGNVYEGQWIEGVPHGKGRYAYASGNIYEGEFEADLRHGHGQETFADGAIYEGEFQRGDRHGKGKYTFADGRVLITGWEAGQWVSDDARTAQARWLFAPESENDLGSSSPDPRKVKQEPSKGRKAKLEAGRPTGQGAQWSADRAQAWETHDGRQMRSISLEKAAQIAAGVGLPVPPLEGTYEGETLDGQRHGRGKFVYAHGATYEGEWAKGQKHGAGKLVEADGGTYEGDWMEDLKHGHGKEENADGSGYEGEYRMGQKQGNGSYVFADGNEAFKFISRRSRKGLI